MLSPKKPIALLPQDREIMRLCGMTEAEYREFLRQAFFYSRVRPGDPVNFSWITFAVTLVVGLILSAIAASLMPKPSTKKQGEFRQKTIEGQNILRPDAYAAKAGFDAPQNVVELNSVVPLVYARRHTVDGAWYGGVRVNTNLLWSQIMTTANNQMLRAVFLVSEGSERMEIDPRQFAIGNNLLRSYQLDYDSETSRLTVYWAPNGGRITEEHYIAGRVPDQDKGNAMNNGARDVYEIRSTNNAYLPEFCMAIKPSTQTSLGLYEMIGNRMGYKLNPQYRPLGSPMVDSANSEIVCQENEGAQDDRREQRTIWWTRGQILGDGEREVRKDDLITYVLDPGSPYKPEQLDDDGAIKDPEEHMSVAQSVASIAKQYDESLSVGDLYKVGSALAVLISRTPEDVVYTNDIDYEKFESDQGNEITCVFKVIEPGTIRGYDEDSSKGGFNATEAPHIYKIAIPNITLERPCEVVELGFRSSVGVQFQGMTNFRDMPYGPVEGVEDDNCEEFKEVFYGEQYLDYQACEKFEGIRTDGSGCNVGFKDMNFETHTVGTYTSKEKRYQFFRIMYRNAAAEENDDWTVLSNVFGIVSETNAAIYNFMRFDFPEEKRWTIRMVPLSGWEIRNKVTNTELYVMDSNLESPLRVNEGDLSIYMNGYKVPRTEETFRILALSTPNNVDVNNGPPWNERDGYDDGPVPIVNEKWFDDGVYYGDAWGRLAEEFYFNEIQTTANRPETEIVYANIIAKNETIPTYNELAIVGLNIRSSREINQLDQFSVYMESGLGRHMIDGDESAHLFPDVLYDLLTNKRYGVGNILSPKLIDVNSFKKAARWTEGRKYFFDGTISENINLRSWAAEVASNYLLDLTISGGVFGLKPTVRFDEPEEIVGLFTAGNILEDSFQMNYVDQQDRQAPIITVRYREERESDATEGRGLFPVFREVTVKESGVLQDAPLEDIDLSDYCTSVDHAIDRAKLECRIRRLITHTIKFSTTPTEGKVAVGSIIKLGLETVKYEQPRNGAIDSEGRVTAFGPLPDGTYEALIWDGNQREVRENSLVIQSNKCITHRNAVFSIQETYNKAEGYKVTSVGFNEDGNLDIEAMYWPLDDDDYSLITKHWGKDWLISGASK